MQQFSFAQHDLYVGAELMGGMLGGTALNDNLLNQKNYSPTAGGQVNLHFRLFDFIGLEAGIGQHWSRVRLRDDDFESETADFSIRIKNTHWHWNYYAAVSTYFRIKKTDSYLYGKLAYSKNFYGSGSVNQSESFGISRLNIDRRLDFSTNYQASNTSFIPEIGIQHKFYKGNVLSLGLRYNIGQSEAFSSEYKVTDQVSQTVQTDQLSSNGNSFALTLRFDYRLKHFDKKEKVKKFNLDEVVLDVRKQDSIVEEPQVDTLPPKELSDRELVVRDKITVHSAKVKVEIWDHQTVDGDRVSLNLNNEWIIENYELRKKKLTLELELKEGLNTFVLYALNLGKIAPNTAALIVDDGDKKHRLTLQSNLKESGTLQIKYKIKKDEK